MIIMRHLLDVNVWVALFAEEHVHHGMARDFLADPDVKLATCPLVESGVLRVMNSPAVLGSQITDFEATREALMRVYGSRDVLFWDDAPSLVRTQVVAWRNVTGYRQITDLQLLSLAVAHDAAFTTFDQRVSLRAVHGAEPRHLRVL